MGFESGFKMGTDLIDKIGQRRESRSKSDYYDSMAEKNRREDKEWGEATELGAGKLSAKKAIRREDYDTEWDYLQAKDQYKQQYPQAGTRSAAARAKAAGAKAAAKMLKQDAIKKKLENRFLKRTNKAQTKEILTQSAEAAADQASANAAQTVEETAQTVEVTKGLALQRSLTAEHSSKERKLAYEEADFDLKAKRDAATTVKNTVEKEELAKETHKATLRGVNVILGQLKEDDEIEGGIDNRIAYGAAEIMKLPEDTEDQRKRKSALFEYYNKEIDAIKKSKDYVQKVATETREAIIDSSVKAAGPDESKLMADLKESDRESYDERRLMHWLTNDAVANGLPLSVLEKYKDRIYENKKRIKNPHWFTENGEIAKDEKGNILENRVLDPHFTRKRWESFKPWWKARYGGALAAKLTRSEGGADVPLRGGGGDPLADTGAAEAGGTVRTSDKGKDLTVAGQLARLDPNLEAATPPQAEWDAVDDRSVQRLFELLDDPDFDQPSGRPPSGRKLFGSDAEALDSEIAAELEMLRAFKEANQNAAGRKALEKIDTIKGDIKEFSEEMEKRGGEDTPDIPEMPVEPREVTEANFPNTTPEDRAAISASRAAKAKESSAGAKAKEAELVTKFHKALNAKVDAGLSKEFKSRGRGPAKGPMTSAIRGVRISLFGEIELSRPNVDHSKLLYQVENDPKFRGKSPEDWPEDFEINVTKLGWFETISGRSRGQQKKGTYREKVSLDRESRIKLYKHLMKMKKLTGSN